jgi:hypothetical protein
MREKIMLIAGGSDPAGSEIDGTMDSEYNRQHSFGNLLANKLGYRPINIAMRGVANGAITRSILEWFQLFYKPEEMDVFVLIGWANSSRMDAPCHRPTWYNEQNPNADWTSKTTCDFIQIQHGNKPLNPDEMVIYNSYDAFIIANEAYLEVISATHSLQLQYFFNMHKVPYLQVNTLYQFTKNNTHVKFYLDLIDRKRYLDFDNPNEPFYYRYANMGYKNTKAKYWHHGEEPHRLYSEHLYKHITENNLLEIV